MIVNRLVLAVAAALCLGIAVRSQEPTPGPTLEVGQAELLSQAVTDGRSPRRRLSPRLARS